MRWGWCALLAGELGDAEQPVGGADPDLHPDEREQARVELTEVVGLSGHHEAILRDPPGHRHQRTVREAPDHVRERGRLTEQHDAAHALVEPPPPLLQSGTFAVEHEPAMVRVRVPGVVVP